MDGIRGICANITRSRWFTATIVILILVNAIIIGLETYPVIKNKYFHLFYFADLSLLWIFTIEIFIRLLGSTSFRAYIKDPWNLFDVIIIVSSHAFIGAHYVTVLRVLRVLRIVRTISVVPSLRKMVSALLLTIPSMGTILLLLSIFFYIYAILGTVLFDSVAPEYFGTLHDTLLTLFQLITLDSWSSGIMRTILEDMPFAWVYFISFVIIGAFIIINLFVGVVVNNVQEAAKDEEVDPMKIKLNEVQAELKEIRKLLEKEKLNDK